MREKWIVAMVSIAMPLLAQETNSPVPFRSERRSIDQNGEEFAQRPRWPDWNPAAGEEFRENRLELMEKALERMGVTEEQRSQIVVLQQSHREKMKENMQRLNGARGNLSRLQESGAGETALDAAIHEVSEAQAEQLKILVHNRMEMERILGKEKYAQFMENARMQFRRHGRHGGPEIPPRPGLPPLPGDEHEAPPLPGAHQAIPLPPIEL